MNTKSNEGDENSSAQETSHQVAITVTDENKPVDKSDRQPPLKRRGRSCFEWIQLIATIWIPIVLAIYTLVENKSNESIAVNNRLKDLEIANISRTSELEIAQANRWKDIEIANVSRITEREIAEANRLNELDIAEQGRQKDRDLATDQQRQNILIEYESFLAKLILENGVTLGTNPKAKVAARFMTRAVLNQLDTVRRSILFRSLYDASMIILKSKVPGDTSLIDLRQFDLSGIRFSLLTNFPETPGYLYYAEWYYLWIPGTILKNASFRYTYLACADFTRSILDLADLSFARSCISPRCFDKTDIETSFYQASLVNTSWYKAHFCFTTFAFANLTFADMQELTCSTCDFSTAILFKADLSKSKMYHGDPLNKGRLPFFKAILRQAVLRGAGYRFINFDESDWSDSQASEMKIFNCTFTQARMENCSLSKSNIYHSFFRSANLSMVDLSDAELGNVSFVDADMRKANLSHMKCEYCDFSNVFLDDAVLKNASFVRSNFRGCHVSASQLEEAADLSGSTLPNGTVVKI